MGFKFSKGSRVEVLSRTEVPSGCWRCAEIVSGNGHTYIVRYDHCSMGVGLDVERVPRKDIRPCPPPIVGLRSWVPGDVVEVLEDGCWKPAQVSKVVDGGNYFLVRLLGLSREFRAHESHLRLRESWKDNMWVVIEKESEEGYDGKVGILSIVEKLKCGRVLPFTEVKRYTGGDDFLNKNERFFDEPYQVSSRDVRKRKQLSSHNVEAHTAAGRKVETAMELGKCRRLIAGHSFQLPEKSS